MNNVPQVDNPAAVFVHYLERLEHWLVLAEQTGNGAILAARLTSAMLPFSNQVRTAARFALRGTFPLFNQPLPPVLAEPLSLSDLQQEVSQIRQLILELPRAERISPACETLTETAGFVQVELPTGKFLSQYVLPNFFFHLSMVYAIARQHGVPLGKADFDGYHAYPAGFTFE